MCTACCLSPLNQPGPPGISCSLLLPPQGLEGCPPSSPKASQRMGPRTAQRLAGESLILGGSWVVREAVGGSRAELRALSTALGSDRRSVCPHLYLPLPYMSQSPIHPLHTHADGVAYWRRPRAGTCPLEAGAATTIPCPPVGPWASSTKCSAFASPGILPNAPRTRAWGTTTTTTITQCLPPRPWT